MSSNPVIWFGSRRRFMQRNGRSCRNLRGIATILALTVAPAAAEESPRGTPPQTESQTATIKPRELDSRQLELRGVEDTIGASEEQRRQIEVDIENLRNDRARLLSALLATTENVNAAAQKISET